MDVGVVGPQGTDWHPPGHYSSLQGPPVPDLNCPYCGKPLNNLSDASMWHEVWSKT